MRKVRSDKKPDKFCINCKKVIDRRSTYCLSCAKKKSLNPNWIKNWEDLTYQGKHSRMRELKQPKPITCEKCGKIKIKLDCSNKDHKYSKNLNDWWWICNDCHNPYDIHFLKRKVRPKKDRTNYCSCGKLIHYRSKFCRSCSHKAQHQLLNRTIIYT